VNCEFAQKVDELSRAIGINLAHRYERGAQSVESLTKRLIGVGPSGILKRGYAIVRKGERVVTKAKDLRASEEAVIEFHDGKVVTKVQ
jgi:exodeoxyribonuclease VII large subunit